MNEPMNELTNRAVAEVGPTASILGLAEADRDGWAVELLDPRDAEFATRIANLRSTHPNVRALDTLQQQVTGLLETRHPGREFARGEVEAIALQHVAGDYEAYGVWVFYPWLDRLVHVLPELEFRELRTSRNRNKITLEEQSRLRALRLGVVGLSVGQATAVTLALEEIGGLFRLADFDRLELSNMNRLRTGVHELGLLKAHITAREILEINPFVAVEVFDDGLDERNLAEFFAGLDLVFDECDDLAMKVRIREHARQLRIPVLMETSDRGLLDVERFDLEPDRPLFHGLAGALRADDLRGLSTYEKVPTVMKIIGQETMSKRMASSLIDIDTTLKTWPQLASAVALGGALNADAARRIALGTFHKSGRFFVDIEEIVGNDGAADLPRSVDYAIEISEQAKGVELPFLRRVAPGCRPDRDQIERLVAHAALAPSGGNCQPWRFEMRDDVLIVLHDRERSANFLDFEDMGSHVAFGGLAESLQLAAREMGLATELEIFPRDCGPDAVIRVRLAGRADIVRDPLVEQIGLRCTNRRLGKRDQLPPELLDELHSAARAAGADVRWIHADEELDQLADILGKGDRIRMLSPVMHRELMSEVRWSKAEVERSRDGLDVATLELTPTDLAGMRLVSSYPIMAMVGRLGAGAGLEKPSRKSIAAAAAAGLITVTGRQPADFVRGGRAMQRLWLTATRSGVAFQPMTAITFLFERQRRGGMGISAKERRQLLELEARHRRLFTLDGDDSLSQVMLFRLARAGPPTARSLRRSVGDMLKFV